MKRKINTPFVTNVDVVDQIADSLGAVVMDPAQVPEHWLDPPPPGKEFAIYMEGRNVQRPDWSRREALALAQACLRLVEWRQRHLDRAIQIKVPRPISMPQWVGVAVCPRCQELQIKQSNATKGDLCWACPGVCRGEHRSGARTCEQCRSEVRLLWTTNDEIPEEWYA